MTLTKNFDFLIQWHLTERCNLRCRHCYQSGTAGTELTLAEIREVLAELTEMLAAWQSAHGVSFSPGFNITGGEPFLRSDFFTILAEIAASGHDMYVLSNGTLIDETTAARLAELNVAGVQVSMEGPEELHNAIRGQGSFSAAVAGVNNLLRAGLPVTLNVTLSRLNASSMPEMVALAAALGVQRLGVTRLVPAGRGTALIADMLGKEEVRELYEGLFALSVPGLEIVTGDPVAAQMGIAAGTDQGCTPYGGCAAGVSGLTILADGTVVPCRRLDIPLGNVRTDSLREIWATSPILTRLRRKNLYGGKCATCERWGCCRGCRAIAYAYSVAQGNHDFLAEDPQCFLKL